MVVAVTLGTFFMVVLCCIRTVVVLVADLVVVTREGLRVTEIHPFKTLELSTAGGATLNFKALTIETDFVVVIRLIRIQLAVVIKLSTKQQVVLQRVAQSFVSCRWLITI